jgi:diguanylate cyclase (GGDEF)-like protein/PAS domain S-box-containing protein
MAAARTDEQGPATSGDVLSLTEAETELLQRARATFRAVAYERDPSRDLPLDDEPPVPVAVPVFDVPPVIEEPASASGDESLGRILLASLDGSEDPIGVFAWPGGMARWLNTALDACYPGDGAGDRSFMGLLDEWSQAQFLVRALPDLLRAGRWQGRLGFESQSGRPAAMAATLVAHRDDDGQIDAFSLVAHPLGPDGVPGPADGDSTEQLLAALVQHVSDLIVVVEPGGDVLFASPAALALLDVSDAEGMRNLTELLHPDDRPAGLQELATSPDDPNAGPVRLRVRGTDGAWRQLSAVVTDLTEHAAVGGLVLNARDVTDESDAILSLVTHAYTDELTGLPNRVRLVDRVSALRQERPGRPLAFLLVDFDHFRAVNEQHGPALTDTVLNMLAHRLVDAAPGHAVVARLRSDEFAVVLADVEGSDAVVAIADGLRDAVRMPIRLEDRTIVVTATIGVALTEQGTTDEQMLAHADQAVRRAKLEGRDRTVVHDGEAARREERRRRLDQQLRSALDDDGLRLRYQPVVDLRSGRTVGVEALLRVRTDDGQLQSPAAFVEAAESGGLISRLGLSVLRTMCGEVLAFDRESSRAGALEVSVNVSPRQVADASFAIRTLELLDEAGFDPRRLLLEITEGTILGQGDAGEHNILVLRDRGVQIGLDEFGGNTSLGYLRRFPLDFVKIDRSLIAGLGGNYVDTAIVRAVIELAQKLGLKTVAVGVETEAQEQRLRELGCDRVQGYLLGGPVAIDDLAP